MLYLNKKQGSTVKLSIFPPLLLAISILFLASCGKDIPVSSSTPFPGSTPAATPEPTPPIPKFNDLGIQACIDKTIAITGWSTLAEVTSLNCEGQGINDLSEIALLTFLTELSLDVGDFSGELASNKAHYSYNNVWELIYEAAVKLPFKANNTFTDISALKALKNLVHLKLKNADNYNIANTTTPIDLTVINEIYQLKTLVLLSMKNPDISNLINLEQLSYLTFYDKEKSLSLNNHLKLTYLEIDSTGNNLLNTLGSISNKSELRHLRLKNKEEGGDLKLLISQQIGEFDQLESISFSNALVFSEVLANFSLLKRLTISEVIEDISTFIEDHTTLQHLSYLADSEYTPEQPINFNLENNQQLQSVYFYYADGSAIYSLNLPAAAPLFYLNVTNARLNNYNLTQFTDLNYLHIVLAAEQTLPDLTLPQTDTLTHLNVSGAFIKNPEHLNYPELTTLKLTNVTLDNLNVITNAPKLDSLSLSLAKQVNAEFLTPIYTLSNLSELELTDITSVDEGSFEGISNLSLKTLSLINVPFTELTVIENMTTLEILIIAGTKTIGYDIETPKNALDDISQLSKLVNLEHLILNNNQLSAIDIIGNFPKLQYLDVSHNLLTTLTSFTNNIEIKEVWASSNQLTSLETSLTAEVFANKPYTLLLGLENNDIRLLWPEIGTLSPNIELYLTGNPTNDCLAAPFIFTKTARVDELMSYCFTRQ